MMHPEPRGFHGIEFHPDYPANPTVYFYTSTMRGEDHFNQLVMYKVINPEDPATLTVEPVKVLVIYAPPYGERVTSDK